MKELFYFEYLDEQFSIPEDDQLLKISQDITDGIKSSSNTQGNHREKIVETTPIPEQQSFTYQAHKSSPVKKNISFKSCLFSWRYDITPKPRERLSKEQTVFLMEAFDQNPYPTSMQREKIAQQLNLDSKQLRVWFQNKRATSKKGIKY